MILFSNLLNGIAQVLDFLINVVIFMLILRALLSWLNIPSARSISYFCAQATEPLVAPFRRWIKPVGALDLSVLALFAVLIFVQSFLVSTLRDYAVAVR